MNSKGFTERQYRTWKKSMSFFGKNFRCHQLPERSFHINGIQFPLCARCTGIFFGFVLLGPILSPTLGVNLIVSLALILFMCIDGLLQLRFHILSNNPRRLISGLGFGYSVFSLLYLSVCKLVNLIQ